MDAKDITPVLPVPDLDAAVAAWRGILGIEPTFVDGTRWAQFDLGGRRLALAGTDRAADVPSLMVKVGDLAAARSELEAAGAQLGPVEEGPHELRCVLDGPAGCPVVLYEPRA